MLLILLLFCTNTDTALINRYTMGSIAKGVFGVDAKTFEKAESEFAINANKIQFRFNLGSILRAMVVILAPRLAQFFGLRVIERSEYFPTLVRSAIRFREEQDQEVKEKSNDFLSILLDLKEEAAKKDSLDQRDSSDGSDDDDTQFEKDAELKGITKKAHIDESMIEQVCSFSRFKLNENAIFSFLNFACVECRHLPAGRLRHYLGDPLPHHLPLGPPPGGAGEGAGGGGRGGRDAGQRCCDL